MPCRAPNRCSTSGNRRLPWWQFRSMPSSAIGIYATGGTKHHTPSVATFSLRHQWHQASYAIRGDRQPVPPRTTSIPPVAHARLRLPRPMPKPPFHRHTGHPKKARPWPPMAHIAHADLGNRQFSQSRAARGLCHPWQLQYVPSVATHTLCHIWQHPAMPSVATGILCPLGHRRSTPTAASRGKAFQNTSTSCTRGTTPHAATPSYQ